MAPIKDLINHTRGTSTHTASNGKSSNGLDTAPSEKKFQPKIEGGDDIKTEALFKFDASKSDYTEKLFPEIDKNELTRLIIQTLSDLGYDLSSSTLQSESGLELDSPIINDFVAFIKSGDFQNAERSINSLNLVDNSEAAKKRIRFLIKREKFLEQLFSESSTQTALKILRNEVNELTTINNIRSLTSLLMDKKSASLQVENGWIDNSIDSSRNFLLNEICKFINPNEMIPKYRLFKLLQQSIEYQKSQNLFQFGDESRKVSLYEDLKSDKTNFPNTIIKTLTDHSDEVWYIQFSHDGSKLVTTSADSKVHIYDVLNNFKLIRTLDGHEKQVMYASFSPDDTKLLTCDIKSKARLWNVETGEVDKVISLHSDSRIWCSDWFPNGESFVLGSPDKEISIHDAETGEVIHSWSGSTINDLKISSDYKLIAATYEKNIEVWDLITKNKIRTLEIGQRITSVTISKSNPNVILINVSPNELQLWDWNEKLLLAKFVGHKQEKYIIRSCFGYDEKLICSGSEDGRVFLWNKDFGALLGAFEAHKGNTNCVTWNPKIPSMFATCGDDSLVRIWGASGT